MASDSPPERPNSQGSTGLLLFGIGTISAAVLALEIAVIRLMSLTSWMPYAHLVIGTALMGFGASGSMLSVMASRLRQRRFGVLALLSCAYSITVIPAAKGLQRIPLNELALLSDAEQWAWLLAKQLVLFVPFLFVGGVVGWALSAWPEKTARLYAANMIGSGVGAGGAIVAMFWLHAIGVIWLCGVVSVAAAAILCAASPTSPVKRAVLAVVVGLAAMVISAVQLPLTPAISPYKGLSQALRAPDAVHEASQASPFGRIDIVSSQTFRQVPGMSLTYSGSVPAQKLLFVDADGGHPIPRIRAPTDWSCFDVTTAALPFAIRRPSRVLSLGLGGLWQVGPAAARSVESITICEPNWRLTETVLSLDEEYSGWLRRGSNVTILDLDGRGLLQQSGPPFDIIVFPLAPRDAVGGLASNFLLTTEAFISALDRLSPTGIVAITAAAGTPPRPEVRLFATAVSALKRRGISDPGSRIVWVRNMETVTLLISVTSWTTDDLSAVRSFCDEHAFDLAWLPGIEEAHANRWFQLDRPFYYEAARSLLSHQADRFLNDYVFAVAPQTDDRPFFQDFFRWRSLPRLIDQLPNRWQAFVTPGYLLAVAGLVQSTIFAALLILLPLSWTPKAATGIRRGSALAYFGLLGLAYMTLEMAMIARLSWFLSDPVLAASVVIAGFLVLSGIGSFISLRFEKIRGSVAIACLAAAIFGVAAVLLMPMLSLLRGMPLWARMAASFVAMAPLAIVMGLPFPLGMSRIAEHGIGLRAWAWGVNGFFSVIASVLTVVVAAWSGYSFMMISASCCYGAAALVAFRFTRSSEPKPAT
jgi:hypothetical protein